MDPISTQRAKKEVASILQKIEQERDELVVRAHLLKAESKEEWAKVEKQYDHFKSQAEKVGKEAKSSSDNVYAAAKLLGEELISSFNRIRKSM
jgi:hypothetical protein